MKTFQPMLASPCKAWAMIRYPILGSLKLDGIRCLIRDGVPVSRNMKPISNDFVRKTLAGLPPLDGELIVGAANAPDVFNVSTSGIMRGNGQPDFVYHVFDLVSTKPYAERHAELQDIVRRINSPMLRLVEQRTLNDRADLETFEAAAVADGYEGVMLRSLRSPYKFGRSTENEGYLMKVKRFQDREAVIVDCIEQQHNGNPAMQNAFGRTERSTHKAGMKGMNTLGAFSCTMDGVRFEVGSGFNNAQRDALWAKRASLPGKIVTFKSQGLTPDGKPRFPVFKGLRHPADL